MPFYQYYCELNETTVEVSHAMGKRLKTWGEVCEYAHIHAGETPPDTSVIRLISKPLVTDWKVKGLDKDAPSDKLSF